MKTIDFSCKHNVLLVSEDGTWQPMDEPYFKAEQIAPNTWSIISDGDFAYLVAGNDKAIAIDTGCGAGNICEFMQTLTDKPVVAAANTHHHFDHTASNCYFDLVYMAKEGVDLATIPFGSFEGIDFPRDYPVQVIKEGDVIDLGGRTLEVFAMPDHAISSLLYLDRKERILFVGDEIGNHGKMLSGTVENFKKQLEKLMSIRSEFDYMCGGSHSMIEADYVERYLENCNQILSGTEGKPLGGGPGGPGGPKGGPMDEEIKGDFPEGAIVFERKKPRPCDRGNGPEDAKEFTRAFEYAGCRIIYDIRKVR